LKTPYLPLETLFRQGKRLKMNRKRIKFFAGKVLTK
jgi:hypothetical protein